MSAAFAAQRTKRWADVTGKTRTSAEYVIIERSGDRGVKMTNPTRGSSADSVRAFEVTRWCDRLAKSRGSFFSDDLAPVVRVPAIILAKATWPNPLNAAARQQVRELVADVCMRRHELLGAGGLATAVETDGHRLVYYPDWTDFCALGLDSGVVDDADAPAWDFWIATGVHDGQFCIVSYIPPSVRPSMDYAVSLSRTGALAWSDSNSIMWDSP